MTSLPANTPDLTGLQCLITQPIHPQAITRLQQTGLTVRHTSSHDMTEIAREITTADAVIVRDAGLNAEAIAAGKRLRVIANHGVGTNKVDVAAASAHSVPVVNTPGTNARSVAEHAITLMLAVAHRVASADHAARSGDWHFRLREPMRELHGKTLGIVGYGRIGQMVADTARLGFGMRVIVWSPSITPQSVHDAGFEWVADLPELLRQVDIVSLHRPSRPDTKHTLDAAAFAAIKPGAIVVNTSRGDLIDEDALADALNRGVIFGAGLDVFETEPLPAHSRLIAMPNVILAPHVAGSTQEALLATAMRCVDQVLAVLSHQRPAHLVNPDVWEHRRC